MRKRNAKAIQPVKARRDNHSTETRSYQTSRNGLSIPVIELQDEDILIYK